MPTREYMVRIKDTARVHIFPVRRKATGKRGKRNRPTSVTQEKLNQNNRENYLGDLLNLNFSEQDIFLRLSYAEQPASFEEAAQNLYNYIRRVRYWRKKHGLPDLKAVYVTEQGIQGGRIHHHVFMSGGVDRDQLEKIWGFGYANTRRLQFNERGVIGLSKYCAKARRAKVGREKGEEAAVRTWNSTHNLAKPQLRREIFQNDYRITERDAAHIDAHPEDLAYIEKLYPDYYVAEVRTTPRDLSAGEDQTPILKAHFVTLYLYRKDADFLRMLRRYDRSIDGDTGRRCRWRSVIS